jgi:hypothetical protein
VSCDGRLNLLLVRVSHNSSLLLLFHQVCAPLANWIADI